MRARQVAVALIILTLPVGFMYRMLLIGRPLARDDASAMVYPIFHALDEQLARGDLYLWDPRQWCGLPALAGGETTGLYPPTLALCALLPWISALHASYWLHLALAAAAVYWVARNLGAARGASLIGGAAFAFSGYQAGHLIHHNHITALAHIPLMLAVLQTALARNSGRWWALLALEIALAWLCSHPMLFVMSAVVCLLWLVSGHDRRADDAPTHTRLVPLLLAAVVAALLVTPQLLPALELADMQGRVAAADVETAVARIASYPFRPADLVRVLLPSFYGTVHAGTITGPAWHETNPFTGAAPLLLGLAGAIAAFRRRGWAFCIATFVVGAALMPAEGNPIHAALARLPFWGGFRATGRWMVLPILSLSLLCALAITHLPAAHRRLRAGARRTIAIAAALIVILTAMLWLVFGVDDHGRLWLPGTGGGFPVTVPADSMLNCLTSLEPALLVAAALIAWIVTARLASGAPAGALSLLALLLAVTGPQWHLWQQTNRTVPRAFYRDPPAVTAALRDGGRITTLAPEVVTPLWQSPGATRDERMMARRELLTPALGTVWDLSYADGYIQGLITPATGQIWQAYHVYGAQAFAGGADISPEALRRYGAPTQRMKRLHRLAAIRHIVTTGAIDDPDLQLTHEGVARVYSYTTAHPRWWLAREPITLAAPAAQMDAIKLLTFDPDRQVVVDREIALEDDPDAATGAVALIAEAPTRLTLRASCPRPRVLVLADAWYPGWSVTVDDAPADLLRANFAFRGVVVPAGTHTVTFSFRPATWHNALPMFAIGLLVVIALVAWPHREPPRRGLTPPPGAEEG